MGSRAANRITNLTALALISAVFAFGGSGAALAQEPPIGIPAGGPTGKDLSAIPFYSWLVYPSINFLALNSNNFFLQPQSGPRGWEFVVTPAVTAIWSNGIHTTTIYGNVQRLEYPTNNELNGTNGQATFTQQYAPLRDLNFALVGDYTHQTLQSALTNAIPNPIGFTGITVLPNGNIVLPNGNIIDPTTGQVIGHVNSGFGVTPLSLVSPFDQYTATARAQKIFSYGIVTLGASVARTNYVNAGTANFTNKTFNEDAAFWLGSVFYIYSDGAFNTRDTDPGGTSQTGPTPALTSTAYRIIGGIGTRQIGLFRASAYFGHQGSTQSGSAAEPGSSAGGDVYGASLTYYPTSDWTISAHADETINRSSAGAASNQAINIPGITPLQFATTSSTAITSAGLTLSYTINPLWSATGTFGFTHAAFLGSPAWDDSYVADVQLTYQMGSHLTLGWDYQHSSVVSNQPLTNANRNQVSMTATYKF
jgi:hypothetical protein